MTSSANNNDVTIQMREEVGESTVVGAATAANLKFGLIPARLDKNFWRGVKKPFWYGEEKDEKGRDIWTQKKFEILTEVNRLFRRQMKEQSRQQGQPLTHPSAARAIRNQTPSNPDRHFTPSQPRPNRFAKQVATQTPTPGNLIQPLLDKYRKTS